MTSNTNTIDPRLAEKKLSLTSPHEQQDLTSSLNGRIVSKTPFLPIKNIPCIPDTPPRQHRRSNADVAGPSVKILPSHTSPLANLSPRRESISPPSPINSRFSNPLTPVKNVSQATKTTSQPQFNSNHLKHLEKPINTSNKKLNQLANGMQFFLKNYGGGEEEDLNRSLKKLLDLSYSLCSDWGFSIQSNQFNRKAGSIGLNALIDFKKFLFDPQNNGYTNIHDRIVDTFTGWLLILNKKESIPVVGWEAKESVNVTRLSKWIGEEEITDSTVKNLMLYKKALTEFGELLTKVKIQSDLKNIKVQLTVLLNELNKSIAAAFPSQSVEDRQSYLSICYQEIIDILPPLIHDVEARIQYENLVSKRKSSKGQTLQKLYSTSQLRTSSEPQSLSTSPQQSELNSSVQNKRHHHRQRSNTFSNDSNSSDEFKNFTWGLNTNLSEKLSSARESRKSKRKTTHEVDDKFIKALELLDQKINLLVNNFASSPLGALEKPLKEIIEALKYLLTKDKGEDLPTPLSIGITLADCADYLFNQKLTPSKEHDKLAALLGKYLLNLKADYPVCSRSNKAILNMWIEEESISELPILNLYHYAHALKQLITIINNESEYITFNGCVPEIYEPTSLDKHKLRAHVLGTTVQIASVFNGLNRGLKETFEKSLKDSSSNEGKDPQTMVAFFTMRYIEIGNALNVILNDTKLRIQHEESKNEKFKKLLATDWKASEFPSEENLGKTGNELLATQLAGKDTEIQYILESGALDIKNNEGYLFEGKKVAQALGKTNLAEMKNVLANLMLDLAKQLSFGKQTLSDLEGYLKKYLNYGEPISSKKKKLTDDMLLTVGKCMQEICAELYKIEKMQQEKKEPFPEILKLLMILRLLHQRGFFAYGPNQLNVWHQQVTGQRFLSNYKRDPKSKTVDSQKFEKPTKKYTIRWGEDLIYQASALYDVRLTIDKKESLSNQFKVKEILTLTVPQDRLCDKDQYREKSEFIITLLRPIQDKNVREHLDIFLESLFRAGISFKIKKSKNYTEKTHKKL